MKIVEEFTQGKAGDEALNDDKIVKTPHFTGVLDGATSRQGLTLAGMQNGRFAAHALAGGIAALPPDIDAKAAVKRLTAHLKSAAEQAAAAEGKSFPEIWSWPASALLLYSHARREIWRVADSSFMIDGNAHYRSFAQEDVWSQLRRAHLYSKMARGATREELLEKDPSWELLTPIISEFKIFANYDGPYGYGVLNGMDVPECHIEVFDAKSAREIVMATDGYPEIFGTLAETEKHLADTLEKDPLMTEFYPQVKGVKKGWLSFDDRAYIRIVF